jgi:hypothetical protein
MGEADELERRLRALAARHEATRARARKRERAEDLRRKILLGALVLSRWPDGQPPDEWRQALEGYLTRGRDRALFTLRPSQARPVS